MKELLDCSRVRLRLPAGKATTKPEDSLKHVDRL